MFAMILNRNDASLHNTHHNSCFEFKQRFVCASNVTLVVLFYVTEWFFFKTHTCLGLIDLFHKVLVICESLDKIATVQNRLMVSFLKINHNTSPHRPKCTCREMWNPSRRFLAGMKSSQLWAELRPSPHRCTTNTPTENRQPEECII